MLAGDFNVPLMRNFQDAVSDSRSWTWAIVVIDFPLDAVLVGDEDNSYGNNGNEGSAEETHGEVAQAMVVTVFAPAPGRAGVSWALLFINHDGR